MVPNKIMLIDDSHLERTVLSQILRKNGYDVVDLPSGENCLTMIDEHKPDLVLLDIMMPDISGDAVLQLIREKYSAISLPVIMITGRSDATDVIEFLRAGANDYIVKPVNFEVTLMRISNHLQISYLSKETTRLQQTQTLNAIITTYNHELNNPLAIAIGLVQKQKLNGVESPEVNEIEKVLWRISSIVKKIEEVGKSDSVQFNQYSQNSKKLQLG